MSTGAGSLTSLGASPSVTVNNAADGSGTAVISPTTVLANTTQTETLTYTTPAGGMTNGAVTIDVPAGWTAPQKTTNNAAGYTTATANGVSVAVGNIAITGTGPWTVTISSLNLNAGQTAVITYGDTTSSALAAATAPTTTGAVSWAAKQKSTAGGTLTAVSGSQTVAVNNAADGTGTNTVTPLTTLAGTATTETFTYTVPTGGMTAGAVTIDVPAGWTAPQTGAGAGQVTSSTGTVSVAGQTITVSALSLNAGQTVTISYLAGTATTTTGAVNWTSKQKSTAAGTLTNISAQPSVTVNNAADGSGTNTVTPLTTLAGTATTETFTYTVPTGGMTAGAVTIDVPAGWTAPQLALGAGQVTSSAGTVSVAGQTVTVSALSLNAGATVTITYAGGIATTTVGAANWTSKQKSTAGGTLTNIAVQPSVTVNNAADGTGTNTVAPLTTLAGTATTETFTYTAPTGGMTSGAVTIDVPAGWTAPQLAAGAGQVSTTAGTISVAGQTITVSALSRNAGQTVTITYAGGIATTTTGAANWTSKQKSTAGGGLTNIAAQPSVTVNNAVDGSGTNTVTPLTTFANTATTETFTYTAPTGGMTNGAVSIDVAAGWTAPQTGAGAGQVTASTGTVAVAGQTATVSGVSLNAGATLTITYTSGIATTTTGVATWTTKQKSTAAGTLTAIGASPSVTVNNAADGSGTNTVTPLTTLANTATTETFTYTVATGGMTNGAVTIDVPAGWTAPQTGAGAGQVTSSAGAVSVAGQTATVSGLSLNGGATVTITYAGGIAATTTGVANWTTKQKSTAGGTLTNVASQPSVTVNNAADGSGTNTVTPLTTLAGTATTETFTYTVPTGGMTAGAVTIDVPAGWTAPQLAAGAGQVSSSAGTVSVAGQTITVSALSLNAGATVTITYAGGTATTTTGAANWTSKQKSTAGGLLSNLGAQPSVTVNNAVDGSGTNTVTPLTTLAGTATTETFTYTAPTGGMTNGAVTIDVPAGWTAPQLAAGAGQVTSNVGTVSVAGQTITVDTLSRNAGQTVTITYAAGIATTTTGAANWTSKQKATAGGTLTNIASQPSVTVNNAADGSGTAAIAPTSVLAGTTQTETLTYTTPTGGMTNGAITVDVPAGWTAPQTGAGAGQVTSSVGTVGVAGQTITISGVSRNAGQTVVITYAAGIATTTTGAVNWTTKQKSTAASTLTNIAAQPSVTVNNAGDGTGTASISPTTVLAGTNQTETLTYTAPTGGMTTGSVSLDVPAGWSAPQKATNLVAGYTTATANAVPVAAGNIAISGAGPWTITISGVSLNAGQQLVLVYGDASGNAAGAATVTTTASGLVTWTTKQMSTSTGSLTSLGASPSVTVNNAADGSGTNTVTPLTTLAGTATTETFTYTVAAGGMTSGAVTIDVPAGWTAPQTGAGAGQVTSTAGSVGIAGQTATVSGLSLNAGQTVTITYSAGIAPTTTGAANWTTKQKSNAGGTLTNIGSQPSVTVNNAADGTGTNTVTPLTTLAGTATTETFTYTVPTGGMTAGAVTIDVPAGWTAPQLAAGAGQATSTAGTVAVAGQTITVSALSLNAGQTFTVTYTGGSATTTAGAANWTTKEKSTAGGALINIASQPSVTVNNAADGTGTNTVTPLTTLAGTTTTETFTYTAPTGGMTNGAVSIDVPAGWTAPQIGAGAGQVTSTVGSVAVAGQTATISGISRNAGQTVVITYAGGTATTTAGAANWTTKQKSTAGGGLANIASQPSVTVNNAADGTGTNTVTPLTTLALDRDNRDLHLHRPHRRHDQRRRSASTSPPAGPHRETGPGQARHRQHCGTVAVASADRPPGSAANTLNAGRHLRRHRLRRSRRNRDHHERRGQLDDQAEVPAGGGTLTNIADQPSARQQGLGGRHRHQHRHPGLASTTRAGPPPRDLHLHRPNRRQDQRRRQT